MMTRCDFPLCDMLTSFQEGNAANETPLLSIQ